MKPAEESPVQGWHGQATAPLSRRHAMREPFNAARRAPTEGSPHRQRRTCRCHPNWCHPKPLAIACLALFCCAANLSAQTIVSGVIRQDTIWSGEVTIASSTTITGGTVRVEPGSIIRFAGGATTGITLRLDTPALGENAGGCARLVLAGTPEMPILVETPQGKAPGSIVAGSGTCGSIQAEHVIFRNLGESISATRARPSILLQLSSPQNDLSLVDCRFEGCGPLRAEFFGREASGEVRGCTFTNTRGPTALTLAGTGDGPKMVIGNRADAAVEIDTPQVLLRENVLIGETAFIFVPTGGSQAIRIASNYVHCTTRRDGGRYALKCDTPAVLAEGNVFIGGTYVAETAPQRLMHNVLIGTAGLEAAFNVPGLEIQKLGSTTTTHYLVAAIPPDATITDNLLLGPAFAAIAIGPTARHARIEHNVLDGWGQARRAVDASEAGPGEVGVKFLGNVVARYRMPPISAMSGTSKALAEASENVFAATPEPPYQGFEGLKPANDHRIPTLDQLGLPPAPTSAPASQPASIAGVPADAEARLLRGELKVEQVCQMYFAAYHLSPTYGTVGPRPAK
jgi:hypothetical protein